MLRNAILAVLFALPALAQTVAGSLTGVVTDASGAAVSGARVQVTNEESGVAAETRSNEAGLYRVTPLNPGRYRVEIEAAGFQRLSRSNVAVPVSQTVQLDVRLSLGSVQETVSVTAAAPVLESQSSSVGQLIERQMIEGMPLPNRSATALVVLTPGAVVQSQGTGGENIPIFSVAGGRMRNQQFTLDGGNVTNVVGLAVPQQQTSLPMEAMQEFRVITNNYAAEHGHSTGGIVTLSTRAGSNQFHGSLFEYLRNEALDARNFFAATKAPFRQHQFGGALGGPIRKDKTHFFGSFERTQQVTGSTVFQTVPTARQRTGDFSETRDANGRLIPVYDPATTAGNTRQPFPGNVIPTDRIDPVARAILQYWPLPNLPGTATGANNFSLNVRPTFTRNIVVTRFDHQFTERNQLMVRYYLNDNQTTNPGLYQEQAADAVAALSEGQTQSVLGSWTHMIRSNLVNEFRLGHVRRKNIQDRFGRDEDLASRIGLRGVSGAGFPILSITGYQALGGSPFRLQTPILDTQAQNATSWFRGKHAVKAGVEARWGYNRDDTDTSSSGSFGFTPLITGLPGMANTGQAFASFLLGEANTASAADPDVIASRAGYWALYVQDDWRIANRLTLNLGLRWEAEVPRTVEGDRMNAFDTQAINPVSGTPGVVTFAGRNGVPRSAYDFDGNNFGPRVGFAWRLPGSEKMVVRGGGGIFYGPTVSSIVATAATLGFATDVSLAATQPGLNSALRLRDGFPTVPRTPVDQSGPGFGAVPLGQTPRVAVSFFERDRPTPASYQYNLNIQHELAQNLLLELGYLGNQSRHLTAADLSYNQVPPERIGPGNAQLRRPFPQFTNVSVVNPPVGSSSYHAVFIKAERRFAQGLTLLGHYTFSKFIDDVQSFTEIGNTGNYMDFYNRRLDRGLSGSDIPHRAVLSGVYELPQLRNWRWVSAVLGGWKTGVLATLESGPPFTVFSATDATNAFPAGPLRADVIGDPRLPSDQRSLGRWFNTDAFRVPAAFQFGTAGRSLLRGPGAVNVDVTLVKSFAVTERWRAEVRGEFYNAFNHANFGLPAATVNAPAFGTIRSARPGRSIQLAARVTF